MLLSRHLSYSTINSYRSALNLITNLNEKEQKILGRFLKGVFNIKPPKPRYTEIWDPTIVLEYLQKQSPIEDLTLEDLTMKLTMLLALTSGHRVQTLSKITTNNISTLQNKISIKISGKIKTSGPNRNQPVLQFPFFKENPSLCLASTLTHYLNRTRHLRTYRDSQLLLTFRKPHHPATSQSISRWIKTILERSGVDTSVFKGHSTRHASTSAAARAGLHIDTIRNTAGWSSSSEMFNKFYNLPLISDKTEFANAILRRNK